MLTDLAQLKAGAVFYLKVLREALAYQVDQIKVVLLHDTTYLEVKQGKDYCTLVTCTPYAVNTHRLLVRGNRIPLKEVKGVVVETEDGKQNSSIWSQECFEG